MRIFKCKNCGKIIVITKEGANDIICCGEEMTELKANSVDAAVEKHVPVVSKEENVLTVTCGEVLHPMEETHYIEFMVVETDKGFSLKYLNPGEEPICKFSISDDEQIKNVYAYCNLHGLWVSQI